jgi:putative transcriptional regulator
VSLTNFAMILNQIKKFREQNNLTQEQLGAAVGVSRQTIIAMEKGNYEPSLGLALKLAKFFKVSVEELFKI